ncbi:MAG: hypothetical protein ACYCY2_08340 [Acidithiobacillus ferriphilus]
MITPEQHGLHVRYRPQKLRLFWTSPLRSVHATPCEDIQERPSGVRESDLQSVEQGHQAESSSETEVIYTCAYDVDHFPLVAAKTARGGMSESSSETEKVCNCTLINNHAIIKNYNFEDQPMVENFAIPIGGRVQRARRTDAERKTRRTARQSRLAKGVHLQRHQWESLFIAAVVQHQLPGQVSGLLYVIYQECVQSVQIIEGAPKLLWVFDRPIRDLAADGMPDGKQRAAKHLSACLGRLESYELIRRLESRKGRPVVFEVLLPSSEAEI